MRSRLDVDFYKFTMGQFILKYYRDTQVVFKLIIRDKDIPVAAHINERELRDCLDYVMDLQFSRTDLYFLRGIDLYDKYMFKEDYLDYLRTSRLPPYQLKMEDGQIELTFSGSWVDVSPWETAALAIISELYYRSILRDVPAHELEIIYARAKDKIYSKLEKLLRHPNIRFADFGQRRRHSFLWQEWVVGLTKEMMGAQFTGTSNTWMAFHHDLPAIGTNAHELPMVATALANGDEEMRNAQYQVLKDWEAMYGQGLRIMLPDTYTSEQFFANAPAWLASWRGVRQDSGDSVSRGELYLKWFESHGADPKEKLILFSDGLDVDPMIMLDEYFHERTNPGHGWGSLFMNDFRGCHTGDELLRPFSMVCKVVEANGRPCVKLSDNPTKATGPKDEVERYKRIFGVGEQTAQAVIV
ncbi:MAG: nicotinate phosphoribosyltransferase [Candidatus Paceibacterota bacterium]